jgi:hypothetical protein
VLNEVSTEVRVLSLQNFDGSRCADGWYAKLLSTRLAEKSSKIDETGQHPFVGVDGNRQRLYLGSSNKQRIRSTASRCAERVFTLSIATRGGVTGKFATSQTNKMCPTGARNSVL